jgi:hypothetical protein
VDGVAAGGNLVLLVVDPVVVVAPPTGPFDLNCQQLKQKKGSVL